MVAACIAASILSYMCIPSVKNMMNKIVTMFATGDFGVVRGICGFLRKLCCGGILWTDGAAVCHGASSGLPHHLCQRKSLWVVAGGNPVLVQCHGRRGSLLYIARILGRDAAEKADQQGGA